MGMWSIKCVICMFFDVLTRGVKTRGSGKSVPWTGVIMNSVRCGRLSVRRRPIFIYYHLCVVVYLKYWNIQILSYRKNKYMSIRFSQFFFPDHLRSSEVYQIEILLGPSNYGRSNSKIRAPPCGGVVKRGGRGRREEVPSKRGHLPIHLIWGTTSGFWRI